MHAQSLAGPKLVVSGDGVQHPHLVYVVVLVVVRIVRVQRIAVEFDVGIRFLDVQQCLLDAVLCRGLVALFWSERPIVSIVGNSHDDLLRRNDVKYLAQVFDEPILGGDGARRRSQPMLVVVHQHDGVTFLAEEFVIVRVVARR